LNNHIFLPNNEKNKLRLSYGYIIILVSFLLFLIASGSQYSFGVFFKPLLNEFGWTRAAISGAYSMNMLLGGCLCIFTGRLNDKFGPRLVLTIGGLFMGLGYLLMSQVHAIWQVYLFYGILVSIGMSAMTVPLISTAVRWFSIGSGLATGIVMSGSGVGIVVVPPLANLLIANFSWRTSYIILGSAALVLVIVIAQFLRLAPRQKNILVSGTDKVTIDTPNVQFQGISFMETIRTRPFWIISLMGFFFLFGQQVVLVHIVAYATDIGISAAMAATILSVIGIVIIFGDIGMGSLGDRVGNRNIIIVIFILSSLAFLWLRYTRELWMLYLFAVIFGIGYGVL